MIYIRRNDFKSVDNDVGLVYNITDYMGKYG